MAYLFRQENEVGENGLACFLRVIRDETDPEDAWYLQLDALANQVVMAHVGEEAMTVSVANPPASDERRLLLGDLRVTLRRAQQEWTLQVQNGGERPLMRVTLYLHPGQALWVNKHQVRFGTLQPAAVSAPVPLMLSIKQPTSQVHKAAYPMGVEVVYLCPPNSRPQRLQKQIHIIVR